MRPFFDTNILVYAQEIDSRSVQARALLRDGGVISAQVLNEFCSVARRKLGRTWPQVIEAVEDISVLCTPIIPLTAETNAVALALAHEHGFSFYDALIVAAALQGKCDTLYSEDLQDGRSIAGLTIVNPFA